MPGKVGKKIKDKYQGGKRIKDHGTLYTPAKLTGANNFHDEESLPRMELLEEALEVFNRLTTQPENPMEIVITEWDEGLGETEEEFPFELEDEAI